MKRTTPGSVATTAALLGAALVSPVVGSASASGLPTPDTARVVSTTRAGDGAPTTFVENVGQFSAGAQFQVRSGGADWWLGDNSLWLSVLTPRAAATAATATAPGVEAAPRVSGVNVHVSFVGASAHPGIEPVGRQATHVSYFKGSEASKWHADVPTWSGVRYTDLYPGIDLELSGMSGVLSPRLIVHAGASLDAVQMQIDGASSLSVSDDQIAISTTAGDITLPLLEVVDGSGVTLGAVHPAAAVVDGNRVANPFRAGAAAPVGSEDAVLAKKDLVYSTFVGGQREDLGQGIAVDASGATYITGFTLSMNFPTTPGAFQEDCGSCADYTFDAYVTKVSPNGRSLEYSTYLGGDDYDCYYSYAGDSCQIAVDANGNAYIAGYTDSADFPTTAGAYDRTCASCDGYFQEDVFLTKLNPTGTKLVYSTFIGGETTDQAHGVVVDNTGAAFLTGRTTSTDFPTTAGAFQRQWAGGGYDSFITKVNPAGSALVYSTYLGGDDDECHEFGAPYISCAIAIDSAGNAYVTGDTESYNFPVTAGVIQTQCDSECFYVSDAYISKINPTGTKLVYSTYLGAEMADDGAGIAVDSAGAAYIVGGTASTQFPITPGVFQPNFAGDYSAFVAKVNPTATKLVYSSYLGGSHDPQCYTCGDYGYDIALLPGGAAAVTGYTSSFAFPVTPDAYQGTCGGPPVMCGDVFMSVVSANAKSLLYSTYLGGDYQDQGDGIAVGGNGSIYVTGYTDSAIFPVTKHAAQRTFGGFDDAFVAKFKASVAS